MGYIHLTSLVKSGLKNSIITYFDMMIQTPDVNYRGVSYKEDLREKLIKVDKNHSPIIMKNIKRKINYKHNSKIYIEIDKDTILIEQNEVPFKYRKIMDEICPVVTIGTILKEEKNNDCISLHCFINVEDRPSISTKLPYSPTSVNKKEVACNDNTGTIKLTLCPQRVNLYRLCQRE